MRKAALLISYFGFLLAGSWLFGRIWGGTVYVYVGEDRSPAAIRDINQFMPIDGRVLHQPISQQVFENVSYVRRENELGVQLAHFLVRDRSGRRQFACRTQARPGLYDRVELKFLGVGVSDNGAIPKMTVDSQCASEDELSFLSPIWIPISDIYQSEPKSQELEFPDIGGTSIRLSDLASSWPPRWTLVSVRLYDSKAESSPLVLHPAPKYLNEDSLSFDWP